MDSILEDIDEIVMDGGTTRMPKIRSLVLRQTLPTAAMNTHIDPDITVAY
jgi:molecular chaperone DnaK (HSP70)